MSAADWIMVGCGVWAVFAAWVAWRFRDARGNAWHDSTAGEDAKE